MPANTHAPDALLFITSSCPHCPVVLQGLSELVKQAVIGKLTVINVENHPEMAAEYGVRAAPWLRIGPYTLTGAHSASELRLWAERCNSEEGVAHYVEHLLITGGYKEARTFVSEDTQRLKPLLAIVADPEKRIEVRVGVDALLEAYSNAAPLQNLVPQIAALSQHKDHRVRADACNLLGLSGSAAARPFVAACLDDRNQEVREIATESLKLLEMRSS